MRRNHYLPFIIILLLTTFHISETLAQEEVKKFRYDAYITVETISRHLHILASDSMEGRETTQVGMKKAADYVSTQFKSYGLQPIKNQTYFQNVPFLNLTSTSINISNDNYKFEPGVDYYINSIANELTFNANDIYFAGFGIVDSASGWNDYKNNTITGKIVLISDGEPVNKKGNSIITGTHEKSNWSNDIRRKIQIAKNKGAAAIFFVNNDFEKGLERSKRWADQGRLNLDKLSSDLEPPVVFMSEATANSILKSSGKSFSTLKEKSATGFYPTKIQLAISPTKTTCTNVLGYVEGSDLKDEAIVITGHLDHLGVRGDKIYNGADDNGSGCAAILSMAEAFAKAKREGNGPKRSILFIAFTGEEKGLLGSQYYVENPVFTMEQTVANLNIDMIGRSDSVNRETSNYTYIIGSDKLSSDLHMMHESTNNTCCNISLDYTYNDSSDKLRLYYRSDHYNFIKKGVPAIFYFTGFHDDYHQPTDTVDKIDFKKTASIAKLIFNTAWELANREERIKVDVVSDVK